MAIEIRKMSADEAKQKGITSWPIWTKEISRFDWFYDDQEQCFFLEGDVVVEADGERVEIGPGDFVTFPKGLKCVWNVRKPVRKHYRFG